MEGTPSNTTTTTKTQRPCKDPTLFHLNKSTGRFSAWVRRPNDGNKRHYIGCYTTFHMAARAQDRATLYINSSAAVNFKASDYRDDSTMRITMDEKEFLKMLRDEARPIYKVVAKSMCFAKFQRMEDHMEDLRGVTKFTIREFVAHLAENPSPNPEINEAAQTLLEIFSTPTAGAECADSMAKVARGAYRGAKMGIFVVVPKGKRSPRTSRKRATDLPSSQESNRPRTRAYTKRKLEMTSCPYRRPRS